MIFSEYVCLNSRYIKTKNPILEIGNRSFLYGDGLFETIHANGTVPQFADFHFERLTQAMHILKMKVPQYFTVTYFSNHIKGVLTRNKYFMGARVRITIFRNKGGLYTPASNEVSYLIESSPLDHDKYVINKQGYVIDIYPEIKKPINRLTVLKSTNALIYVMAGIYKTENKLDDCLILNDQGRICESVSSNLFLIKNNQIITPALSEGCLPGIMRKIIIELIKSTGTKIITESKITVEDLLSADELFITNAINGIRWILAYRQKRYYNKFSRELNSSLNKMAFPDN